LLCGAIACFAMLGCGGERAPTNLLLVVVDTLRADGLGVYGNPRPTSPNLDAFAQDAIVFDNAYAPSPNTVPSHASLFTSSYPATHQVWNRIMVEGSDDVLAKLAPAHVTLAEALQAAGYATAAIADGGYMNAGRGLAQGFDQFDSKTVGVRNRFRRAIRWLRKRDRETPFFLFLHTYETHSPYLPPVETAARFAPDYTGPLREALVDAHAFVKAGKEKNKFFDVQMKFFYGQMLQKQPEDIAFVRALYDSEVNVVDRLFGRLLQFLETQGLLEDTLIVVTSDHGEQFLEHGEFYHGHVYEEGLHVPLIVRDPGGPFGVRRKQFVDLVDLMPTILSRLGVEVPPAAVGRPIDLRASGAAEPRFLVGEMSKDRFERQLAVRSGEWSVVFHGDDLERAEVFDVRSDRGEQRDLAGEPESAEIIARAREVAARHAAAAEETRERYDLGAIFPERSSLSDTERSELKALGYLTE
jgi:arylsulfatase A-like enzyme